MIETESLEQREAVTRRRRIVQIAEAAAENGHSLHALCDDGTVWEYDWLAHTSDEPPYESRGGWKQLAAIPQPTEV